MMRVAGGHLEVTCLDRCYTQSIPIPSSAVKQGSDAGNKKVSTIGRYSSSGGYDDSGDVVVGVTLLPGPTPLSAGRDGDGDAKTAVTTAVVCFENGVMKLMDVNEMVLQQKLQIWQSMYATVSDERSQGGIVGALAKNELLQELGESLLGPGSKPRTDSDMPKHGKEDEKNEAHVGGNTWAGLLPSSIVV